MIITCPYPSHFPVTIKLITIMQVKSLGKNKMLSQDGDKYQLVKLMNIPIIMYAYDYHIICCNSFKCFKLNKFLFSVVHCSNLFETYSICSCYDSNIQKSAFYFSPYRLLPNTDTLLCHSNVLHSK